MTSTKTADTKRIPNPVYAAAGAGDIVYQQILTLPAKARELSDRVAALRPVVADAVSDAVKEPARRVDVDKLRAVALRNAEVLKVQAQAAQKRAEKLYAELVARGERVVSGPYKEIEPAGDVVPVTVERADAPSAETPSAEAKSGPGTGKSPAKAVKKTSPSAVK
jgi:heparin binding hemagglutinin HbhA